MWLTDYRAQYGLTLEQLGSMIRRAGRRKDPELWCSDLLLYRLETDPKFRTVPKLADLIAEVCGATAQQRDELVLERYRGKWKPPRRRKQVKAAPYEKPKAVEPPKKTRCPAEFVPQKPALKVAHEVVRLNRDGQELGRYASVSRASLNSLATSDQIISRCARRYTLDEFKAFGYTFRYAEEWDCMTEDERRKDLARTDNIKGDRGGNRRSQMVTVIDSKGHAVDYDNVAIAAVNVGLGYAAAYKRLRRAQDRPIHADRTKGLTLMYTRDWLDLTPEERDLIWREDVELG